MTNRYRLVDRNSSPLLTGESRDWIDTPVLSSGVPDYFGRNKISSGGDLSH